MRLEGGGAAQATGVIVVIFSQSHHLVRGSSDKSKLHSKLLSLERRIRLLCD